MGQQEPPLSISCARSRRFFIGRDSCGNWVVQDQQHVCGGLFVDRAQGFGLRCLKTEIAPKQSSWFQEFSNSI
jgi:hypothetical protein